jgi:hypothetical protein
MQKMEKTRKISNIREEEGLTRCGLILYSELPFSPTSVFISPSTTLVSIVFLDLCPFSAPKFP